MSLGLLGVAAVLAMWVPIRFQHKGGVQGFNVDDAIFVAALFALPVGYAPGLMMAAGLLAYATKLKAPVKVAFNVGQLGVWASLATGAFAVVGEGPTPLHWRSVLAVVAATIVAFASNLVALAELFRRIEGTPWRKGFAQVWRVSAVTWLGNSSFGLLLAVVAVEEPFAVLPAATLLIGLYLGYRGYAGVLEERRRNESLQDLTRSLVAAMGSPESTEAFLDGLCRLFGGAEADLFIADGSAHSAHRAADGGTGRMPAMSRAVAHVMRSGRPLHSTDPGTAGDHRDVIAAPVIYEGRTLGALAVYDRHGLEPWDESDATLLATLANEAALALKNVELFSQVDRERARWEAESTKLADIVDAASDGIAMFSADGVVEAWNAAMAELTGVSSAHALGQPWFIVLRMRDHENHEVVTNGDHVLNQALEGRRQTEPVGLQVLRRDGVWRWINATFAPIYREDTRPAGTVMVARDVTREREVDELKADFVATVSHELRTPLTPLKGFLATLEARREQLDEEQRTSIYEAMAGQLSRLERLVGDLLVVADLDRGALRLEREPVDLVAAVRLAVEREAQGHEHRVELHRVEPSTLAIADGMAVVQIIRAFLSNALKHTDGPVDIIVSRDGNHSVVTVKDTGPGIPPWEQTRIFRRFHRLGDHLQRTQGPGLGLPIAQALSDRLGGEIEVTSEVGQGSEFSLRLPGVRARLVEDPTRASRAVRRLG